MPTAPQTETLATHPWIAAFVADPDREVANFLAGYARIQPYSAAETPDAARMLFASLGADSEPRRLLDTVLLRWLDARRRAGAPVADRPQFLRWMGEVIDAVEIVRILELGQTALDFRRRFVLWNSWIERLEGLGGPDLRAAFLTTLALTQRQIHKTSPQANALGLEQLWLRICEWAGQGYPKSYLSLGLLGLRSLPDRDGVPSQRRLITGLARWAGAGKPSVDQFSREWWSLKKLYHAVSPADWRGAVGAAIKQSSDMPADLRAFWEADVGVGQAHLQGGAVRAKRGFRPASLPPKKVRDDLLAEIRQGAALAGIEPGLNSLMKIYDEYAAATGDDSFLRRSATNVGKALIQAGPAAELAARGTVAALLARKALARSLSDGLVWDLWSDALAAQGRYHAAENIGWSALHRFPDDPYRWTQLAKLLVELNGRDHDAERLLREATARFPSNDVAATQLASLLAGRGGEKAVAEAQRLLAKVVSRSPDDKVARAMLRKIGLGKFKRASRPKAVAAAMAAVPESDAFETSVINDGRLRRLAAELPHQIDSEQWRAAALADIEQLLTDDENLTFAQYLKQQLTGAEQSAVLETSPFAIALLDAMKRRDAERLKELGQSYSEQSQLVDVALVVHFRDESAAARAFASLQRASGNNPLTAFNRLRRPVAALNGFLLQRFGTKTGLDSQNQDQYQFRIKDSAEFLYLIASEDKKEQIDHALIDATFAPNDLLLAA